jgi:hypothetical protein
MTIPSIDLIGAVFALLEEHGHHRADDQAGGDAVMLLGDLVDGYTGRIDSSRNPRTFPADVEGADQ